MAVDLAKLSLWLTTLAKDHPFTFLDHSFKCGDSLVGLTEEQIAEFHWHPKKGTQEGITFKSNIRSRIDRATEYRRAILQAGDEMLPGMKQHKLALADESLSAIRIIGDAAVAAFFDGQKRAERERKREKLFALLPDWIQSDFSPTEREPIANSAASLKSGQFELPPFHWSIEFPEVFAKERLGFDAFVGNPPFAGKNTLVNGNRKGYLDWLKILHAKAHGNSDLVAHFFRRAFDLLRPDGCLGLIATNTIRQGDTRATGLHWIRKRGGTIFACRKRLRWPGQAAVVVSVVWIAKGEFEDPYYIDGNPVQHISAYLFHMGTDDDPEKLKTQEGRCSNGVKIYGSGFTFDDSSSSDVVTPLGDMHRLITDDPKNQERIFPYLGGEELNSSPTQLHDRFVIHFGEMSLEEASKWPALLEIVRQNVKPQRDEVKDDRCRELWWQFERPRTEFFDHTSKLSRVLALSRVGDNAAFSFVPSTTVFADSLVIFSFETYAAFCVMQSRVHESWARFFSSSMKDDMRYTSSDCFETFPFPESFETKSEFEEAGRAYYEFRARVMRDNNEGLTATYNRFNNKEDTASEIATLRTLHGQMDKAVLAALGWKDLADAAHCDHFLDFEEEEDEDIASRRSKPWRYRWPDDLHDEVLGRLLVLNEEFAAAEKRQGKSTDQSKALSKRTRGSRKEKSSTSQRLF